MSIDLLPTELIVEIVASYLPWLIDADEYLALRLLNKRFNHVILYALFDRRVCDIFISKGNRSFTKHEDFIFRSWRAALRPQRDRQDGRASDVSVTNRHRHYDLDDDDREHEKRVKQALQSAIARIVKRLESTEQTIPVPRLSTLIQPASTLSLPDRCIYILSMATIQLHGKHHAWLSLTDNVEHSYFANQLDRGALYIPNHHEMTWELYAAAYLNDLDMVKRIIGSIKLHPRPRRVWRYRLSLDWNDFVLANSQGNIPVTYGNATVDEQKWIKAASSVLVIAGCMGHVDIIEYLMQLEPYFSRNGPRTQLWSTSLRSAMGQAIVYEQREAFKVFLKHKWPLLTSTGFPRMNWWNGLRIALETVQDRLDGNSILESMLDMSPDWKCPSMVDQMLQAAASRNNIQLARIVLDRLHSAPVFLTYSYMSTSAPVLPGKLRNYALGTAAWLGRVDLVDLLLKKGRGMSYADSAARTCAIHALICHLKREEVTADHLKILDNLLHYTDDLMLEQLLARAVYKHDVELVDTIARNIDLKQACSLAWLESLDLVSKCLSDYNRYPATRTQGFELTWGEVMLAVALQQLRFNNARILITKYQVSLYHCYIKYFVHDPQLPKSDVAELEDCIAKSNMTMQVVEQEGVTHFEFRPIAQPTADRFKLVPRHRIHCSF